MLEGPAERVWPTLDWWKFVEWTPPASGRLPGERGSLPWGHEPRWCSGFLPGRTMTAVSGVWVWETFVPAAMPLLPRLQRSQFLLHVGIVCDLLFVAFVIIIILNTLPQRILPLYLTVN